jgi:MoaA/NifB/PqqE/SkfB family radical SAM enzyme
MRYAEVVRAWGKILSGRAPSLSIEITRECPLRCPGCYAYGENHLGEGIGLRQLSDSRGDELVARVLQLVDRLRPLHLSIVGGDPLVRYRELEALLPRLLERGVHVQIVTSAFRPLAAAWSEMEKLNIVVSIDGLQPEHDARRKPATYERIHKNIEGQRVTIHCTITSQMMEQPDALARFVEFWSGNSNVKRLWFSMFTPQRGEALVECLSPAQRRDAVEQLLALRREFPKVDMAEGLLREFLAPPASPRECIFARTTETVSADLTTRVTPCQFGGDPDCSQCGCVASMGLAAVGHHRLGGFIPVGALFRASAAAGEIVARARQRRERATAPEKSSTAKSAA